MYEKYIHDPSITRHIIETVQHFDVVPPPNPPKPKPIWSTLLKLFNQTNATFYRLDQVTFGHPKDLQKVVYDYLKRPMYRTSVEVKWGLPNPTTTRTLTYYRLSLEHQYPNPPTLPRRPNREDYRKLIQDRLQLEVDPVYYDISLSRNDQNQSFVLLTALETNPIHVGTLYLPLEEPQNG